MSENKNLIGLSFDVELWNEGEWLAPYITEDMLVRDTFPASMETLLTLIRGKGPATFFVTQKVTENYPEIIRKIADDGHELGIHGPKHKKLKDYSPEEFRIDCLKQIVLLEQITGTKPRGYRAPHFSLTQTTSWVLPILKDLGFLYDSSIFPKNMGEYGNGNVPATPYTIIPGLIEIPISVATYGNTRIPFAGGLYFRILPLWMFRFFLRRVQKSQTPVLYFHPHELDPETPRISKGPWLKRLLKYWGTKKSLKKFEKLTNQLNLVPLKNIVEKDTLG